MAQQASTFDTIRLIRFLDKWKWHLLIISALAAVSSVVFTGPTFITPKYLSTVIFYPTANNSISGTILTDMTQREKDVLEFGEEEQAEQALQILSSSELMNRVIQRFDLMKHYNINTNDAYPYTRLSDKIKSNIKFRRTEFSSIEIAVLDENPQMAANLANGISEILDSIKTEIQRQVARKAFEIIEKEYLAKQKEVEQLQETINNLTSGQDVSASMLKNPFSSGSKKDKGLEMISGNTSITGSKSGNIGTLLSLTESLSLEIEQLNHLKKKFERSKADLEEYLPQKFVVSPAFAAEKKAKPVRSIIVLVSTVSTFFFAVLILIILEKLGEYRRTLKSELSKQEE